MCKSVFHSYTNAQNVIKMNFIKKIQHESKLILQNGTTVTF